jgi:hypothetical protein
MDGRDSPARAAENDKVAGKIAGDEQITVISGQKPGIATISAQRAGYRCGDSVAGRIYKQLTGFRRLS